MQSKLHLEHNSKFKFHVRTRLAVLGEAGIYLPLPPTSYGSGSSSFAQHPDPYISAQRPALKVTRKFDEFMSAAKLEWDRHICAYLIQICGCLVQIVNFKYNFVDI